MDVDQSRTIFKIDIVDLNGEIAYAAVRDENPRFFIVAMCPLTAVKSAVRALDLFKNSKLNKT